MGPRRGGAPTAPAAPQGPHTDSTQRTHAPLPHHRRPPAPCSLADASSAAARPCRRRSPPRPRQRAVSAPQLLPGAAVQCLAQVDAPPRGMPRPGAPQPRSLAGAAVRRTAGTLQPSGPTPPKPPPTRPRTDRKVSRRRTRPQRCAHCRRHHHGKQSPQAVPSRRQPQTLARSGWLEGLWSDAISSGSTTEAAAQPRQLLRRGLRPT
jgi:hypothetical protein